MAEYIRITAVETETRKYYPVNQYWYKIDGGYFCSRLECEMKDKTTGQESIIDQWDEFHASSVAFLTLYYDDTEDGYERYILQMYLSCGYTFNLNFKDKDVAQETYEEVSQWWKENRKK